MRRDHLAQEGVVAREHSGYRAGLLLPQARAALNIGEQEGHDVGRERERAA